MNMNKPTLQANGTITCPKWYGYWDLTHYPWGGSFHRFTQDCTAQLIQVVDNYHDGKPRKVRARIADNLAANGYKIIGIELQ